MEQFPGQVFGPAYPAGTPKEFTFQTFTPQKEIAAGKEEQFCPRCGQEISFGDRFCQNCGQKLNKLLSEEV